MADVIELIGVISEVDTLTGIISDIDTLVGEIDLPDEAVNTYEGAYEVTPMAFERQTLDTENKKMLHDVTVYEIPYYLTTNLSGGYTAIIG